MTEHTLKLLPINELLDLFDKSLNEVMALDRSTENEPELRSKKRELELIQKTIIEKRAEFPPLK